MTAKAKAKTPRFYVPADTRQVVLAMAQATGLTPGQVIAGAVSRLVRDNARTGQPFGAPLRRLIEDTAGK